MPFRAIYISAFFLLASGVLSAELRTFTNDWGDSIEAELLELKDGGKVISMRMKNGRKIDAELSAFSEADKKYILKWWKEVIASKQVLQADSDLRINAKMNSKSRDSGYDSWYSDLEVKSFFPEVMIDNKDLQSYSGNEIRVVVFADDMHYDDQIVVVSASTLKTDFGERSQTVLESEPFRLRHYEYDSYYSSNNYEYGYRYSGYAITIKNSRGEVTHQKSTKSKFLNPKLFYKCKSGEMYDDKFERKLKATPSSYYVQ